MRQLKNQVPEGGWSWLVTGYCSFFTIAKYRLENQNCRSIHGEGGIGPGLGRCSEGQGTGRLPLDTPLTPPGRGGVAQPRKTPR